ncbi:hypothetical protein AY601_1113 [Pedobacter cryoconitis]|uniref:Uncharacterized protein n=1 Tax=Pedobacter cryoconitis TaxID=188932 RepID=A0A127VA11_9SPHI|nr:hypothetical protein [Pedobacter cryoconitis]AMP98040.1 hypothetical protein AY601_1113 [Pedobacter cryoconitis]
MKKSQKILGLTLGGFLVAVGFAFSGLSASASDLSELSAKAGDYCTGSSNTDCRSSATGNIYPHMESSNF